MRNPATEAKLNQIARGILCQLALKKHGSALADRTGIGADELAHFVSESDIEDFIKYLKAAVSLYKNNEDLANLAHAAERRRKLEAQLEELKNSAEYKLGSAFAEMVKKSVKE